MTDKELLEKIAKSMGETWNERNAVTLVNYAKEIISLCKSHFEQDDSSHETMLKLASILDEVNLILKGKPPENTLYSYHDIPELVRGHDKQDWISVDAPPELNNRYIVLSDTDEGDYVCEMKYEKGKWLYNDEPTYCNVYYINPKAWQPLPLPSPENKDERD